jgi:hypothetical protein
MNKNHSYFKITFLALYFSLFASCEIPYWNSDIESFVEDGLSTIALADQSTDYISSDTTTTIELEIVNPSDLTADCSISTSSSYATLSSATISDDTVTFELTTTEDADQQDISISFDITATDIGKVYDTEYYTLSCDNDPDSVDLLVGTTDTYFSVAAFTLPSDDDLSTIEITYNLVNESSTTTVEIDSTSTGYSTTDTLESDFEASLTSSETYFYYTPSDATATDEYDYSIVAIDSVGQRSEAVTGSNDADYYEVTWDTNSGSWESTSSYSDDAVTIASGYSITLPSTTDISYGVSELTGWSDGTTTYSPGDSVSITEDTTFSAIWSEYTITYHNGFATTDTTASETFISGNDATLSTATNLGFTNTGYTFAGWSDSESEEYTTTYYDVGYNEVDDEMTLSAISSDTDLYAVWVDGTPIRNVEELNYLNSQDTTYVYDGWDTSYYLTNDLDLSDSDYSFKKIGDDSTDPFSGTFDGLDHTLSNLTISSASEANIGLFGYLTGTVQNLTVSDISITDSTGYDYIGGIAGYVSEGTITDCSVTGTNTIDSKGNCLGGIAGEASNSTFTDNTVDGLTITGAGDASNDYAGGYLGYDNGSTIENNSDDDTVGTVTIDKMDENNGGLIGYATGSNVSDCNVDNVTISNVARSGNGGLIGYANDGVEIDSCDVTTVDISSTAGETDGDNYGGLVGYAYNSNMSYCNVGTVSIDNPYDDHHGGLIGQADTCTTIEYCTVSTVSITNAANGSSSSDTDVYCGGLIGYASDCETITECAVTTSVTIDSPGGNHNGGLIGYADNCDTISGCYVTSPTIDTPTEGYNGGLIGTAYDCDTISGCYVTSPTIDSPGGNYNAGLIGYADNSTITDCYVTSPTINTPSGNYNGGLIGYAEACSSISDCDVTDATLLLNSTNYAGGVVGSGIMTSFTSCTVTISEISNGGAFIGGFGGSTLSTSVSKSTVNLDSSSSIGGESYVGGFIGYLKLDTGYTISESCVYGEGSVTGTSLYVGGFAGQINGTSDTTIDQCYANINLISDSSSYDFGGFIGASCVSSGTFTISNCYFKGDISYTSSHEDAPNCGFMGYCEYGDVLELKNCYTVASNSDLSSNFGLMYGTGGVDGNEPSVEYSYYWNGEISPSSDTITTSLGTGLCSDDLQDYDSMDSTSLSSYFGSWDTTIWGWDTSTVTNDGYPYLKADDLSDSY